MPSKKQPCAPTHPRPRRPAMPKEYGIEEPSSGAGILPWKHVSERMSTARNYWIGTTRPDGRPRLMPVWGIWFRETFLFSTSRRRQKARNLARNPNLVVHLESGNEVVILEGWAHEVTEPSLLAQFAEAYNIKYQFRPNIHDTNNVTYAVSPRVAFAWLEADFPGGATRWQF